MILADYRCGCTWVGKRSECIEYCGKHGEERRLIHRISSCPENEQGWSWQMRKDGTKKVHRPR
jgi:hypothetical protein